MDAKTILAHTDKVVYIRRVPAWVSSEELGRQVGWLRFDKATGVFICATGEKDGFSSCEGESEHLDRASSLWLTLALTPRLPDQVTAEAPKHDRIVYSDAANARNDDFARAAFIVYKTPEKATKALQKLSKMRIYQHSKPKGESYTLGRVGSCCSLVSICSLVYLPYVCDVQLKLFAANAKRGATPSTRVMMRTPCVRQILLGRM